ncbi:MAG: NAD-dependent epimerase/dehydratase family protein [Gemmataceae bacterium]
MRYLITGGSGFVGGHVAETCARRGKDITAIVRPAADASFLEQLGARVLRGELSDAALVRQAFEDVEVVIHCAAKVGDWGPVDEYRKVNVECLRVLLEAAKGQALSRFLHMSSLGVYAAKHHYGSDETVPLPRKHRDGYSQSKVEAEQLAMSYYRDFGVPVVILRPGFVYGPRDKVVLPRIIQHLKTGWLRYPGGGGQALNTVFIGNLVDAVLAAIDSENAVGQIYNLTDGEHVSKRRFIETIADSMGLPRPTRTPPYWIAWLVTWCAEKWARLRGRKDPPLFNFSRFKFMALNLDFSIEKAKLELGWLPRYSFQDAMEETLAWYKTNPVVDKQGTVIA